MSGLMDGFTYQSLVKFTFPFETGNWWGLCYSFLTSFIYLFSPVFLYLFKLFSLQVLCGNGNRSCN